MSSQIIGIQSLVGLDNGGSAIELCQQKIRHHHYFYSIRQTINAISVISWETEKARGGHGLGSLLLLLYKIDISLEAHGAGIAMI